jgi:hypothetical protein
MHHIARIKTLAALKIRALRLMSGNRAAPQKTLWKTHNKLLQIKYKDTKYKNNARLPDIFFLIFYRARPAPLVVNPQQAGHPRLGTARFPH